MTDDCICEIDKIGSGARADRLDKRPEGVDAELVREEEACGADRLAMLCAFRLSSESKVYSPYCR